MHWEGIIIVCLNVIAQIMTKNVLELFVLVRRRDVCDDDFLSIKITNIQKEFFKSSTFNK